MQKPQTVHGQIQMSTIHKVYFCKIIFKLVYVLKVKQKQGLPDLALTHSYKHTGSIRARAVTEDMSVTQFKIPTGIPTKVRGIL